MFVISFEPLLLLFSFCGTTISDMLYYAKVLQLSDTAWFWIFSYLLRRACHGKVLSYFSQELDQAWKFLLLWVPSVYLPKRLPSKPLYRWEMGRPVSTSDSPILSSLLWCASLPPQSPCHSYGTHRGFLFLNHWQKYCPFSISRYSEISSVFILRKRERAR